jgi:dCMP deaminase
MRPSWDRKFLELAASMAQMGTCERRQVGCFLVDHRHRVLSTGINGVPSGWEHCRDNPGFKCPGAGSASGTNLDGCWSRHAEANAIDHCARKDEIHTCYTTASPCISCVKQLLHTSCCRIVFLEPYPQPEAILLWTMHNLIIPTRGGPIIDHRTWEQMMPDGSVKIVAYSGQKGK